MASRQGGPSSFTLGDTRDVEYAADAGSDAPCTSSSDEPERGGVPCQWRTSEFCHQECHHYFDCPSHLVERRLSMNESGEVDISGRDTPAEPETRGHDTPAREPIDVARTSDRALATSEPPHESSPVAAELSRSSPRPSAVSNTNRAAGPVRPHSVVFPMRTSSMADRTHVSSHQEGVGVRSGDDNNSSILYNQALAYHNREPAASVTPRNKGSRLSRSSLRQQAPETPPIPGGRTTGEGSSRQFFAELPENDRVGSAEVVLPKWQPDADVTYCPICHTQFNIFLRKHHCRKCGRVVCNSCSPHRIIIPHQFIVRPPGSEAPLTQSLLIDGLGARYVDMNGLSGGERVRLCNPCVPDPNTAPPQSPTSPSALSPRSVARHRSRSSLGSAFTAAPPVNGYGGVFTTGESNDPHQFHTPRSRSITMDPAVQRAGSGSSSRRHSSANYQASLDRLLAVANGSPSLSPATAHHSSRRRLTRDVASSSRHRTLPPSLQIAEEDECPICHQELPSQDLPNFESLRESHITSCIQTHSTYGSPRTGLGGGSLPAAPRRTGMYTYQATEKDCVDDEECTICLEEFAVGVPMARLECLCRFHRACIAAWFANHPGRCPVHQHDGFGY